MLELFGFAGICAGGCFGLGVGLCLVCLRDIVIQLISSSGERGFSGTDSVGFGGGLGFVDGRDWTGGADGSAVDFSSSSSMGMSVFVFVFFCFSFFFLFFFVVALVVVVVESFPSINLTKSSILLSHGRIDDFVCPVEFSFARLFDNLILKRSFLSIPRRSFVKDMQFKQGLESDKRLQQQNSQVFSSLIFDAKSAEISLGEDA